MTDLQQPDVTDTFTYQCRCSRDVHVVAGDVMPHRCTAPEATVTYIEGKWRIDIGGQDVTNVVQSMKITATGHRPHPYLELLLPLEHLATAGESGLLLTEAQRGVLEAFGWTPPLIRREA